MNRRILLSATLIFVGASAVAAAQLGAENTIGSFKKWTAYTSSDGGAKTCFVASQPTDSKYAPSKPKARDQIFFMVTTIPGKKIKNEASTIIGYTFKDHSKVTVDVEGKKFTMFTDKDNAWIEDPAQEAPLVSAMKGAKTMTLEGVSARGTTTTDTYSLAGLAPALDAIAKECPVK